MAKSSKRKKAAKKGTPESLLPTRPIRARYDAARTTADNRNHWAHADSLSPDAALSPGVRRTLRIRARYEIANNAYAKGMETALIDYVIGTGPALQVLLKDKKLAREVELDFATWALMVDLAAKLRTMRAAKFHDGEAIALLITNPKLDHEVKLDLRLIEADQMETPNLGQRRQPVSGIKFDEYGNPAEYHILKDHPGAAGPMRFADFDRVPASQIIHWFTADRPGQTRAIPEVTPALPIFSQLRRYTLAVLTAAETAADMACIMKTQAAPEEGPADVEPMAEMDFVRGMAVFAPSGWEPSQMKAEQPSTVYVEYVDERLREAARCVNMPLLIVLGSAKDMNYSSGKLDHQGFFRYVDVDEADCEIKVLEKIFAAWFREARALYGIGEETLPHQWGWPEPQKIDKQRETKSDIDLVEAGLLTEKRYWERQGLDADEERRQRDEEHTARLKAGMEPRKYQEKIAPPVTAPAGEENEDGTTHED